MTRTPTSAYRQDTGHSASPVRLVVILHEQLVHDMQRALTAIEKQDIEGRAREINHALLIVGQLQGSLNYAQGEEVARNLDSFYHLLRANLMQAHVQISSAILQKQIGYVLELREAWIEVERQLQLEMAARENMSATIATTGDKAGRWSG